MTPDEYLKEVLAKQRLADDSPEMKHLRQTRQEVEELLRAEYGDSPIIRYGGSKAKNTMIRISYDLDMTCYFPRDDEQAGKTIEDIYNHVAQVLEKKFFVERKRSALRLTSKDNLTYKIDLHVDVVPGRFIDGEDGDVYLYQNEGDKRYLKTNLDIHIAHIRDSGVTNAIKLLKLWKVLNGVHLKTFVLELLVIDLLKSYKNGSLSKQVLIVLQAFRDRIDELSVEDPANPTGNDLTDILDASRPSLNAVARRTLTLIEQSGWQSVFGSIEGLAQNEKIELLQHAASLVSIPTKPWWTM